MVQRTALLPCTVTGYPRPTVSWSVNGTTIVNGTRHQTLSNGTLKVSDLTRLDDGVYVCTATNDGGDDTTKINLIIHCTSFIAAAIPFSLFLSRRSVDFSAPRKSSCRRRRGRLVFLPISLEAGVIHSMDKGRRRAFDDESQCGDLERRRDVDVDRRSGLRRRRVFVHRRKLRRQGRSVGDVASYRTAANCLRAELREFRSSSIRFVSMHGDRLAASEN